MPLKLPVQKARQLVTLDFETYWADDYTLSKMTTAGYVRDHRFEQIGVGVKVGGSPIWLDLAQWALFVKSAPWEECAILAHHTHFDGLICAHHYDIKPAFWLCTLSMARAIHGTTVGGSLAKLMRYYGLGEKGDEILRTKNKRLAAFTPEEYARYGDYCKGDVNGAYGLFQKMRGQISDAEFWNIDTTIRMMTEPQFQIDEPFLKQFIREEQTRKAELLAKAETRREVLMSNDKFADLLILLGEDPPTKVSPATGRTTWAFAKTDPGFKDLLEHERDEIRWLAEARVGVKSTGDETRAARLLALGSGGARVPVYLNYYAAHTGRWGGGDKLNFQNFRRGGAIKKALVAPPGYRIVATDSAQIEARVLAWLAGDEALCGLFADASRDIYSEKGSEFFARKITKQADPNERQCSKAMVLGMGYGMGWYKFAGEMQKGMMGAPPMTFGPELALALGADPRELERRPDDYDRVISMPSRLPLLERLVHCAVARELVNRYRDANGPIVDFWHKAEDLLKAMVDGRVANLGPVGVEGEHAVKLPNGAKLRYPGLGRHGHEFSYIRGHNKEHARIYGGMLTENIVQALARIIVADQMEHIRAEWGYPIATMTHDEIVCVVPEAEADQALANMVAAMALGPDWARGCPIRAEGGHGANYAEAKPR